MPAHLSIIQHLLFHLFKLAGKKKITSAHSWRVWEQEEESESVLLRGPVIHAFFFILAKKTTILDLHLLNWSNEDPELHRPQLHHDTISRKSYFTKMGEEKRRGIDSVFCTVVHQQRIVTTLGRRWLQLYPTSSAQFIGGIFTYNWGSFHLACQQA